jgi:hypothetical protein
MKILHPHLPGIDEPEEVADSELVVAMTRDELALVTGGINEALQAVEDWEFETRLGFTREEAWALRARLTEVLRATRRPE